MPIRNLACKSHDRPQEPEVRVEIKDGDEWVRIPVTLCELWVNKDGPSDLTRTGKVKFPIEWGGHDVTQYINGFNSQSPPPDDDEIQQREESNPYDECRIWFYDEEDDTYQVSHYGYIGGVGPASETGVGKFWVYDAADLMRGIQVSKSFGEPTIAQVIEFVLRGEDDTGQPIGLEIRSVFNNIQTYIAGIQEVREQKKDTKNLGKNQNDGDDFVIEGDDKGMFDIVGQFQLNVTDLVDDVFDYMFGSDVTNGVLSGQKRFQLNRHNMVDLMNWFSAEVGGKWHFEPTPDGPVLFFDNTNAKENENQILNDDEFEDEIFESDEDSDFARRLFMDDELVEEDTLSLGNEESITSQGFSGDVADYKHRHAFATVDVLNNNALYDIKPFNTLYLYGESTTFRERYNGTATSAAHGVGEWAAQNFGESGSPGVYTEYFPYVKVVYPPLKERSGGYEYAAPAVESDKIYLDQATHEAKKEFRKHLEEESEGTIETKGEPHILPYDYITTVPQCNDMFPNANVNPITYEVNSVKHRRSAGERYKTNLGVSLVFDESLLTVETQYKRA